MTDLSWLDLSTIPEKRKISLRHYLDSYLTGRRRALFDRVLSRRTRHFTLVAEDTFHEHNASALIRTCDCFGIQDMHVIETEQTFTIARGMTKGAEKWVDVHFHKGGARTGRSINRLRKAGYRIVATTPDPGGTSPDDFDISLRSALFFGREKEGLSREVLDAADGTLHIPMHGFSESFNVSVSAAVILHTLTTRLRQSGKIPWQLTAAEMLDKRIEWSLKTIQNGRSICEDFLRKTG